MFVDAGNNGVYSSFARDVKVRPGHTIVGDHMAILFFIDKFQGSTSLCNSRLMPFTEDMQCML